MDKNTYETYEYLPTTSSNNESEAEPFFVVQDDGTFIIDKQVTMLTDMAQVQDVRLLKGVQSCTVYDVTGQHIFVDNSNGLMSTSEQFIIPNETNSMHHNSYLLKAVSSRSDQVEDHINGEIMSINNDTLNEDINKKTNNFMKVDDYHIISENRTVNNEEINKQTNNFSEITLSEDQYCMLEQKGWVLLEANSKMFLLDTLGLHDITSNYKLIHKLKNDIEGSESIKLSSGPLNIENHTLSKHNNIMEYVIENTFPQHVENQEVISYTSNKQEVQNIFPGILNEEHHNREPLQDKFECKENEVLTEEIQIFTVDNVLNIKTNLTFNDIPDKIALGRTSNGKNLVAKVVTNPAAKRKRSVTRQNKIKIDETQSTQERSKITKLTTPCLKYDKQLTKSEIKFLKTHALKNVLTERHIKFIETIIAQLQMSDYEEIMNQNLVVTKISTTKDSDKRDLVPLIITGKIMLQDEDGQPCFVHMPHLIGQLISKSENSGSIEINEIVENNEDDNFIHLHIFETKDNKFTITINKELLPVMEDKGNTDRELACGGCAEVFRSEEDFKRHQETLCMEPESVLTIDTDKINAKGVTCSIDPQSKEKVYSCLHCDRKFNRITNCQRHIKTHRTKSDNLDADKESSDRVKTIKKKQAMYKCKMCSSSYNHSSTLTKHIVNMHLKLR